MVANGARVILTPGGEHPYKVVMDHGEGKITEHPVPSIAEGEALIRQMAPPPEVPDWRRAWSPLG